MSFPKNLGPGSAQHLSRVYVRSQGELLPGGGREVAQASAYTHPCRRPACLWFCQTERSILSWQVIIRWARSATRHRVNRERSLHVIEHCGLLFRVPPPSGQEDERLLYLGDDAEGIPLEVMAVELHSGELFVVHAMPLRAKYRLQYEEARKWRR